MAGNSNIEWTHHTFNAWSGCARRHAGCLNCYAEDLPPLMRRGAKWGEVWQGGTREFANDAYWRQPYLWARKAADVLERHRVFVNSTSDVLEVPAMPPESLRGDAVMKRVASVRVQLDTARDRLYRLIRETSHPCICRRPDGYCMCERSKPGHPGLDYLLLTKRPENAHLVPEDVRGLVWLLASASDQETLADMAGPLLESTGFRVRGLSLEPLVGPVDLSGYFGGPYVGLPGDMVHTNYNYGIDWVIVGGESGNEARECRQEWVEDVVRQCRAAGVPCFVKQLGKVWATSQRLRLPNGKRDEKGGQLETWPASLRVRQFPTVSQ